MTAIRRIDNPELATQAISRIKVMSQLDIAERRVPQDGRLQIGYQQRRIDVRVSIMPSIHGEDAVLRILDREHLAQSLAGLTLEKLGLDEATRQSIRNSNIRWRWMAEPFGTTASETDPASLGAFTQNLRFPGQYADQESGLSYNFFRDYDSSTGRYAQSDPIGLAGGINTYAYVQSSPVNRVDPNGLLDVFVGGARDGSTRIVASYQQAYGTAYPGRSSLYFEWDQATQVIEAVKLARNKNKCEPINIVGHSYGGSTVASVSRQLRAVGVDVNLLVTIDPVSRFWSMGPGAAANWVNVNAAPSSSNGWNGDRTAAWGGKWGDWPNGIANTHYNAPYHHNEFGNLFEFVPPGGKSALQVLLDSNSSSCTCQGGE